MTNRFIPAPEFCYPLLTKRSDASFAPRQKIPYIWIKKFLLHFCSNFPRPKPAIRESDMQH